MTEVVERGDSVREFISRVRREYRELRRLLFEHARVIYYHCPFAGRLVVSMYYNDIDKVLFDGREVDYSNIRAALDLAVQLSAIARERALVKSMISGIEHHELPDLREAISMALALGIEVPQEALDRKKELEQQLEELRERLRQLDEQCKQLQNPFTEG